MGQAPSWFSACSCVVLFGPCRLYYLIPWHFSLRTLKRSFEVEDVDTSSHLSPGSRRTTNSPHRNAMSPTSIYYRDLGTATAGTVAATTINENNLNYTQPRSIMGGGGPKTPEPVSRRSELSIDISSSSSRPVDNINSPASARFAATSALKRPEVLGHTKTPEMSHKREVTFAKTVTDSPVIRRNEGNYNNNGTSRTPEQNHTRKFEPPTPGDVRKPDISITRAPPENNGHHLPVHHAHHPNPHHNTIVTTFRCSSPSHGRRSPNPDKYYRPRRSLEELLVNFHLQLLRKCFAMQCGRLHTSPSHRGGGGSSPWSFLSPLNNPYLHNSLTGCYRHHQKFPRRELRFNTEQAPSASPHVEVRGRILRGPPRVTRLKDEVER
ncbi:Septin-9 [Liparis tanakae]|uniref:Septin-9 n=1 Tax=Liparis tanakae TaxID=230148 RepID=A0A4Z2HZ37_9TELE|nr:Septin-9 [Liparis tanakae]